MTNVPKNANLQGSMGNDEGDGGERVQKWTQFAVEQVATFKEFVPLSLVLAASVYALGWLTRAIAISSLGAGPIEVNHQSAVAAALTFLALVSPGAILWAQPGRYYLITLWLVIEIGIAIRYTTPQLGGNLIGLSLTPILIRLMVWGLSVVLLFLDRITKTDRAGSQLQRKETTTSITVFAAGAIIWFYGAVVLPTLPPHLGGFYMNPVTVEFTSELSFANMTAKATQLYLVDGDSEWTLFSSRPDITANPRTVYRIPKASIAYVASVRVGQGAGSSAAAKGLPAPRR